MASLLVVSTDPSSRHQPGGQAGVAQPRQGRAPRMIAAVLAVLASTQFPAATLTVRQQDRRLPVAGSMMWCSAGRPQAHPRTVVLEVAKPPEKGRTAAPALAPGGVIVGNEDRPPAGGRGAGRRDVPAEADRHRRSPHPRR